MSWQWTNYILNERRDLKGVDLLCALIVANYASADDKCYPGLKRIALDMRTTVRSVQRHLRNLESKQVFRIIQGNGRGAKTSFELIKGDKSVTLSGFSTEISTDGERATEPSPFTDEKGDRTVTLPDQKGRQNAHKKGDSSDRKGRQNAHSHNINHSFKPEENLLGAPNSRSDATKRGSRIPDDFALTDQMVGWAKTECPGVSFTIETEKFQDYWRAKTGRDSTKLDWIATWRNWMRNARDRYGHSNGVVRAVDPEAECAFCGDERRIRGTVETWPCDKCRPAEYRAWQRQRGKI